MSLSARAIAGIIVICLVLFGFVPISSAQCSAITNFNGVFTQTGNPFQAERVTTRTPEPQSNSALTPAETHPLFIARDSEGRVREDYPGNVFKIEDGENAGTESVQHTIRICDPVGHKLIILDTLNKTATIREASTSSLRPGSVPRAIELSGYFCKSFYPIHSAGPSEREDLGKQVFDGLEARGIRITTTIPRQGTGDGGNENVVHTKVSEIWCSDELSAVILKTQMSGTGEIKWAYTFTKISRGEPDPSLFQIPPGYRVVERIPEKGRQGMTGSFGSSSTNAPPKPVEPPQR